MLPTPTRTTDAGSSVLQYNPKNTLAAQEAGTAGLQAKALPVKKKGWKKHTRSPTFWLSLAGLFILWFLMMSVGPFIEYVLLPEDEMKNYSREARNAES